MANNILNFKGKNTDENCIENFVIETSFELGFRPPSHVLCRFGIECSIDNIYEFLELYSVEKKLEQQINKVAKFNAYLNDNQKLNDEIERYFNSRMNIYNEKLKEVAEINFIIEKQLKDVYLFNIKNQIQNEYQGYLIKYLLDKKETNTKFLRESKPRRETNDEVKLRFTKYIEECNTEIEHLYKQLIFNDTFFEELVEDWFGLYATEQEEVLFSKIRNGDKSSIIPLIDLQTPWLIDMAKQRTLNTVLIEKLLEIGKKVLEDLAAKEIMSNEKEIFFKYGAKISKEAMFHHYDVNMHNIDF